MYDNDPEDFNNNSSIRETSNALLDAYATKKTHEKDIERINRRRGRNEAKPRSYDEETVGDNNSSKTNSSSLPNKDELSDKSSLDSKDNLEKTDELDSKDKKDSKPSLGSGLKDGLKDKAEDLTGIANLKKKWLMLKIGVKVGIIAAIVVAAFFLFILVYSAVAASIETFTSAITNFFGISEGNVKEGDGTFRTGLYTERNYRFDEDGNELSSEELVRKLKEEGDNECAVTILNTIGDKLFGGKRIDDRCEFMRYIKRASEKNNIDRSLVIGTILYGYDTQAMPSDYIDEEDIPKDYLTADNHYEILERILSDDDYPITKAMLDKIIENSIATEKRYYYTWSIQEKKNSEGLITAKTGVCTKQVMIVNEYDLDKWKIFMRFGEEVAKAYEDYNKVAFAYDSSSEECTGNVSESELLSRVMNSGSPDDKVSSNVKYSVNVKDAINDMKSFQVNRSDLFFQHADVNTRTKDTFKNIDDIELDYAKGFAYSNFPGYGRTMTDNATTISYDAIFTPKDIEKLIENIVEKKKYMNEVLLLDDMDNPDSLTYGDRSSSITTGAYCSNYLSAPLSSITVRLTDCYGKDLGKVSFEDYIIGVANAEVSNSHDNYVLSEMLAAISYALKRRNNYSKGNEIWMKSGTCDQAYCSPEKGCTVKQNPDICHGCASFYIGGSRGKESGLYAKYRLLYQTASQYLVVSNGKVHNAHYYNVIQNQWSAKAKSGMYFTQIIQETYEDEGAEVIKCTDPDNEVPTGEDKNKDQPKEEKDKYGNVATKDYPKVAPDLGTYYGFSYKDVAGKNIAINPAWKEYNLTTISPNCSNTSFATMSFTVNTKAESKYQKAFANICKLLTEGVQTKGGLCKYTMNDLTGGTTFTETKTELGDLDLFPYGLAQSWNHSASYTINGKTYRPYNPASGAEEYWEFVNAIGGQEENCQNVNYILWLKAYKPAGFNWGGNYGRNGYNGSFRGNLFEIKYE